jgi:hypothetical protein
VGRYRSIRKCWRIAVSFFDKCAAHGVAPLLRRSSFALGRVDLLRHWSEWPHSSDSVLRRDAWAPVIGLSSELSGLFLGFRCGVELEINFAAALWPRITLARHNEVSDGAVPEQRARVRGVPFDCPARRAPELS